MRPPLLAFRCLCVPLSPPSALCSLLAQNPHNDTYVTTPFGWRVHDKLKNNPKWTLTDAIKAQKAEDRCWIKLTDAVKAQKAEDRCWMPQATVFKTLLMPSVAPTPPNKSLPFKSVH